MAIEINLLPSEKKLKPQGLGQRAKKGIIYLLIFYVILVAGLLGVTFFLNMNLARAESEKATLERKIKDNAKKEQLLVLLKDRLSKEEIILSGRMDFRRIFNLINSVSLEGITFEATEIEKGKLVLNGKADNLASLKGFLDGVVGATSDLSFAQVTSLTRSNDGSYSWSLESNLTF